MISILNFQKSELYRKIIKIVQFVINYHLKQKNVINIHY